MSHLPSQQGNGARGAEREACSCQGAGQHFSGLHWTARCDDQASKDTQLGVAVRH
jgi:hypothetical protein